MNDFFILPASSREMMHFLFCFFHLLKVFFFSLPGLMLSSCIRLSELDASVLLFEWSLFALFMVKGFLTSQFVLLTVHKHCVQVTLLFPLPSILWIVQKQIGYCHWCSKRWWNDATMLPGLRCTMNAFLTQHILMAPIIKFAHLSQSTLITLATLAKVWFERFLLLKGPTLNGFSF